MRKIWIEESDFPLTGDVIYPIRVELTSGECRISVIPDARTAAEAFAADLPPEESLGGQLLALFSPMMRAQGYLPLPMADEPIVVWQGYAVRQPYRLPIYRSADVADLPWGLSHRREDMPDSAFFAVADGRVAAAAWYTPMGVAVETAPDFRRRGFARALVAALTDERCARGEAVLYRCRASNAASMALAESLGFTMIAREYHPGFRRDRRSG